MFGAKKPYGPKTCPEAVNKVICTLQIMTGSVMYQLLSIKYQISFDPDYYTARDVIVLVVAGHLAIQALALH